MAAPYLQIISGTQELVSTLAHFADSGEIPAFTPLMMTDAGLMVPWDGEESGKAVYLTPHIIDTSLQSTAKVYKAGIFNTEIINWPESVTPEHKRAAAFVGSGISVQPLRN